MLDDRELHTYVNIATETSNSWQNDFPFQTTTILIKITTEQKLRTDTVLQFVTMT